MKRREHEEEEEEDGPVVVVPETLEELEALGLPSDFGKHGEKFDVGAVLQKVTKGSGPSKEQLKADIEEFRAISKNAAAAAAAPVPESRMRAEEADGDEEIDEEAENERQTLGHKLPISHEVTLRGHGKAVSALALDGAGARLFTGSNDYTVKLWDFGGMDMRLRSFRSIEPSEGCPVNQISVSPPGAGEQFFVVATGSAQPKMFNRDAFSVATFKKGDQYLSDLSNTSGHVQTVTSIAWNPRDGDTIMTASLDGTVRLWAAMDVAKQQKTVIKAKIKTPRQRAAISAASWDAAGSMIAAAIPIEGGIQIWKSAGPFHRPHISVERAHQPGSETSCLRFLGDGTGLVSRGGDDTMKLWDLRNVREPVAVWEGLPNMSAHTDVCLSPGDEFIATGTSAAKDAGKGALLFYRRDTLSLARVSEFDSSVLRIVWHDRIRQIVVGLSDSTARVLFDPKTSEKGALLCVARPMPREDPAKLEFAPEVFLPQEQDLMRREMPIEKQLRRIKRQERREQQKKAKNPVLPPVVPGTGGRLGSCTTQFLLRTTGIVNPEAEEDPREALIKLDEKTRKNPFFTRQYRETQPVAVFQAGEDDQEPPRKKK